MTLEYVYADHRTRFPIRSRTARCLNVDARAREIFCKRSEKKEIAKDQEREFRSRYPERKATITWDHPNIDEWVKSPIGTTSTRYRLRREEIESGGAAKRNGMWLAATPADAERAREGERQEWARQKAEWERERAEWERRWRDGIDAFGLLRVEWPGVLGVSWPIRSPDPEQEIRNAWRTKAKETHPDHGGDAESFKRISAAYEDAKRWLASQRVRA